MTPRSRARGKRGTTLVEVLIAMALMLLIFLFLTADLIQSSQAENVASNQSSSTAVANYLINLMKADGNFWNEANWTVAPQPDGNAKDPCGNAWPSYSDNILAPTWHPGCASLFPELAGTGVNYNFMWNAVNQSGDPDAATLTVWVMTDEGGRNNVYELKTTRMNAAPLAASSGVVPTTAPPSTAPPTSPPP